MIRSVLDLRFLPLRVLWVWRIQFSKHAAPNWVFIQFVLMSVMTLSFVEVMPFMTSVDVV